MVEIGDRISHKQRRICKSCYDKSQYKKRKIQISSETKLRKTLARSNHKIIYLKKKITNLQKHVWQLKKDKFRLINGITNDSKKRKKKHSFELKGNLKDIKPQMDYFQDIRFMIS